MSQADKDLAAVNNYIRNSSDPDSTATLPNHIAQHDPSHVGLSQSDFVNKKTGFHAGLFQNRNTGEYILAFRGTDQPFRDTFYANSPQGAGIGSRQHDQAIELGMHVKGAVSDNLVMTGHSLGGGLASAAAIVTDTNAVTFNAAGLHPDTVLPYQKGLSGANSLIKAYHTTGDILTRAQNRFGIPTAAGQPIPIRTPYRSNGLNQHFMSSVMDAVNY